MNSKLKQVVKRLISSFIATAMAVTMLPQIPAFAETSTTTYSYDGYLVSYNVTNSWADSNAVTISLTNTAATSIENWMLYFDPNGELTDIWNARTESFSSGETYFRNNGYNATIAPNETISFGYIINNCNAFPDDFMLCQRRVDKEDGYIVDLSVKQIWEEGFYGSIILTNQSNVPIEAWELTLETNFAILLNENSYGADITQVGDYQYFLKANDYTSIINQGESVEIGFEGIPVEDLSILSAALTEVKAEEVLINQGFGSDEDDEVVDIGEAYFKEPTWDDVIVDEATGMRYIKDQLLISAFPGVPKEAIEQISAEVGAEIVGYIAMTSDFQIEFIAEHTINELTSVADYINSFSFISNVTLNFYDDSDISKTTNDTLYNDNLQVENEWRKEMVDGVLEKVRYTIFHDGSIDKTDTNDYWNEAKPDGDNWGLEAIHALSAWDRESEFNTVKVGVFDAGFGEHDDLNYAAIIENNAVSDHGTHVCGTIAATHNNNCGISGVATDVKLYVCTSGNYPGSSMGTKNIFSKLVANHVKVINVSMGYSDTSRTYAASQSEFPEVQVKAQESISAEADALGEFLKKLLMMGYDFVICASAGNADNTTFIVDPSQTYGFRTPDKGESIESLDVRRGKVLAKWNYSLTAITDEEVKNHIIVVGALEKNSSGIYQKASFSNHGERIDVMAPGVDILSTVPVSSQNPDGYQLMSGTSMACPHVTGIVAMMYQVNPELSGANVKQILVDNSDLAFSLRDPADTSLSPANIDYVIPNAYRICNAVRMLIETEVNDVTWPSGVICGYTKNMFGDVLSNVQFSALKKSTGEYNVGIYGVGQHDYLFESDDDGCYVQALPQGTYDILVSKEGYMPFLIRDIVIRPDETSYKETIILSEWLSFFNSTIFDGVQGKVINALTGQPINGATVNLRKGWNNKTGDYVKNIFCQPKTSTTNYSGNFTIFTPYGSYTAEIVKDGFVVGYFNLISCNTNLILTILGEMPTIPLTPVLADGEYRIVLTWGDTPSDLDSHLTYYEDTKQKIHVYYGSKKGYIGSTEVANLDLDDVTSYGPETITLTLNSGLMKEGSQFRYSVHNYSDSGKTNSRQLSLSNATVRVYYGNNMEIFHVPSNQTGTVWHVFDIDANGIMTVKNEFYNSSASSVR